MPMVPFRTKDMNGLIVDSNDYQGQKLLLSFFRKAACPFCNMSLQQLIKRHDDIEKRGIKVVAFFASAKADVLKYAGTHTPPFPVIPDENFTIYRKYRVEVSYLGMLKTMLNPLKNIKAITGGFFSLKTISEDPVMPAEFLIGENQEIHRAHYGKDFDDHISFSDILTWHH